MVGLRPSHFYGTASDTVAIELDLGQLQVRYGEIKMPAAMMFGTADRVLDHKLHGLSMQGRIAGLELEMLDGLGHMLPFMARERAVAVIRRVADRAFAADQVLAKAEGSTGLRGA